jgi:voltage-gated potassium channel
LFTISVIISGITVFATSMTSIFGPLIRGGFNKLVKGV